MVDKNALRDNFIKKGSEIHNNKYDYSLVDYKNNRTKVKIICKLHGIFEQDQKHHISRKQGCPKCSPFCFTKRTTKDFIKKAIEIHGYKYDYSLVDYKGNKLKVKIICKKHGIFEKYAGSHISYKKEGCKICDSGNHFKNTEIFIQDATKKHGDKYDYSFVNYNGAFRKVKIICKKHGIFEQRPNVHLNGSGCLKCTTVYKDTKMFIEESKKIHGNKYDYSLVDYNGSNNKIRIICKKHGIFEQRASGHLKGNGCSKCKSYKGENIIKSILYKLKINYIHQHAFKECSYINQLFFDFYLPDYNLCIEYNGCQHYKPVKYFGGEKNFKITQARDMHKIEFLKNNNINLLIIRYNENIENKLTECLKKF